MNWLGRLRKAWEISGDLAHGEAARHYLFHLDDWGGASIRGWVIDKRATDHPVPLCLMHRGHRVWSGLAAQYRPDLKEAGLGSGAHGFAVPRPSLQVDFVACTPDHLALCVDRPGQPVIGEIDLGMALTEFREAYARLFEGEERPPPPPFERRPASALLQKLFFGANGTDDQASSAVSQSDLPSAYSTFLRDTRLAPDLARRSGAGAPPDRLFAALLKYGEREIVAPVPFSAAEIRWMNESVFFGDAAFPLSRATTYFLAEPDALRPPFDLSKSESYEALVAWWVFEKLPALKAEDCLIPDAYRRLLARNLRPGAHPVLSLPAFMRDLWRKDPAWSGLLAMPELALPLLHARVLLLSLERPALLGFISPAEREHLLTFWEQETRPDSVCPFPGRDRIEARLNAAGATLRDGSPLHFSSEGHRARSFALPVSQDDTIDCQLIGPLDRASGLGQSARMMLAGLSALPLRVNGYNFTTGNPQPSIGGHNPAGHRLLSARNQIFHLNPDQLPLALSQLPDLFSDSRKIGVFYWELDKPAPGDRLALDLVDEIWVATEFCASIYRGCGKPVHVVGLPVPDLPALAETERQRLIAPYLPDQPGIQTILTMYDSLSWIERKNPRLAIEAFRRAFPDRRDVRLVIKMHNQERIADQAQRRKRALVEEMALSDPRIVILDVTMPSDALGALMASADVFLSLHRAEGLGLGMIEAMQRGVPVVATDYSGNRDFCCPDSSWPVAFTLRHVHPGEYVYADGSTVWAEPDAEHAASQLRRALEGPERSARIAQARVHLAEKWSIPAFTARVSTLFQ